MKRIQPILNTQESTIEIKSPLVGDFEASLSPQQVVSGGMKIGTLKILNTIHDLVLPQNVYGTIEFEEDTDRIISVEYGQTLFSIVPVKPVSSDADPVSTQNPIQEPLMEGIPVPAFTMGMFYRRPSPDAPYYVEEGQEITKGTILGLIELMKAFNQIVFQGTERSDRARIKQILVEDSQEVKLGEPLFLIEEI